MNAVVEQIGTAATTVRPFRVDVPEGELTELKRRIMSTRLPEKPVLDTSQGVQLATVEKLARYWSTDYDWRKCEARINAFRVSSLRSTAESLTPNDVLDNCTLYWLTNTGVSSSRLYRENTFNFFSPKAVNIPVAVSVFPDELYLPPRSWAEKAYPKLIHYNKLDKGGHFAAWEQPALFSQELRAGLRSLRN